MFGNEKGGETAVTFGFKDKTNGTAQGEYYEEVRSVIRNVNVAVVQERQPGIARLDAHKLLDEIEMSGERGRGIKPEDVLFMPDLKFFRKRGAEEYVFKPYDVRGNLLTENGKEVSSEAYLNYLSRVLPGRFIGSREYNKFLAQMSEYYASK
jgi:hypothetical protein